MSAGAGKATIAAMTSPTRTLPILPTLALLALLAPAPAGAQWRTEQVPGAGVVSPLGIAFDARGRGLFHWEGFEQPNRRFTGLDVRAAAGGWERAPDLAGVTWGGAQIHLFGSSRALLVTRQTSSLGAFNRARFRLVSAFGRSDGTFGAFRTLDENVAAPVSAANADGAALVAWQDTSSGATRVRELPAGGRFGATRTLSPGGTGAAAMNLRGDRVLAWTDRAGIKARVRRRGGSWGSARLAARVSPVANTHVRALVTVGGRVVLTWDSTDVREDRPTALRAGVAVLDPGRRWRAHTLERSTVAAGGSASEGPAAIPVAAGARVYVAWTGVAGGARAVKFERVIADGPRERVILSAGVPGAALDDAAAHPRGSIVVSWSVLGSESTVTFASLRRGAGAFAAPQRLTAPGARGIGFSRAAFQPLTGEAVVTSGHIAGQTGAVQASVSPPG
jgi:hypothetical protein